MSRARELGILFKVGLGIDGKSLEASSIVLHWDNIRDGYWAVTIHPASTLPRTDTIERFFKNNTTPNLRIMVASENNSTAGAKRARKTYILAVLQGEIGDSWKITPPDLNYPVRSSRR